MKLRNRIRKWLGISDGITIAPETTKAIDIAPGTLSIFQEQLRKAGELFVIPRKVEPPKLPKGVRELFVFDAANDPGMLGEPVSIAIDSAQTANSWEYLNQTNCGMGFPGYGYLAELSQRSEYRAPTETIANELTREWIKITVKGKAAKKDSGEEITADRTMPPPPKPKDKPKPGAEGVDADGDGDIDGGLEDKVERLTAALERHKLRDHFRRLAEVDGFFGRAQLFINIESPNPDETNQLPLIVDKECIKQGSLKGFKVIEPIWTSPYTYNATDPTRPDFYKPRAWFVMGKRVHASRLRTFISREVPDLLKPAYNFGGLSISQIMEPYVFQWLRTRNSVSDLVHNFSVMVLKTDMAQVLQGDAKAGTGLLARAKLFLQTRDNQGLTLIDKEREEMQEVHATLATLDKLQAQSQEHMAAPSHIPLVKLTGITPAGLNADSEGEIQVWYDWVRSVQMFFLGAHLKDMIDIIQLDEFGEVDDAIGYEWVPLSSPTVKEEAEIRKADADTAGIYIDKGVVSPEEVRERVASDPHSGYNNLSGPAPEPPAMGEMEATHKLGQEGADADHARNLEAQEAKAKLDAKNKPPAK